jgi:hypothetical protein
MKSPSKSDRKRLKRLRELTDQLSDRDEQLKRDLQLFEGFFSNFPLPVTMWSIGKDHSVLSIRGEGFFCTKAVTLEEMFECSILRDHTVEKHEQALMGEAVSFFMESKDRVYWTKLVPRFDDSGVVVGTVGLSWDVTSNAIMIHCLEEIESMLVDKKAHADILPLVKKSLSASRLKKMLEEREIPDA